MSVQKLALGMYTGRTGGVKFKILKAEGMGFAIDPPGHSHLDDRADHFKKYKPGPIIDYYAFFDDPDYYSKMYTIIDYTKDFVNNV